MDKQITLRLIQEQIQENPWEKGETYILDDHIRIEIVDIHEKSKGFGFNTYALDFILNISTGIASGIITNIIYDKLMGNGRNKLVDKNKELVILTKEELKNFLDDIRKEENSTNENTPT